MTSPETEVEKSSNGVLFWTAVIIAFIVVFGGFYLLRFQIRHSLFHAECLELTAAFERWTEAGRPQGIQLTDYIRGRRPDIVVSNRSFSFNGKSFETQFAFTNLRSGKGGTLFVTTNHVLIWLAPTGQPEVVALD